MNTERTTLDELSEELTELELLAPATAAALTAHREGLIIGRFDEMGLRRAELRARQKDAGRAGAMLSEVAA